MEQKAKNVSPFSSESRNAYVAEHLTDSFLTLLKEKQMNETSSENILNSSAYAAFFLYGWIEGWFRRGMKDRTEELIACLFCERKKAGDTFLPRFLPPAQDLYTLNSTLPSSM